MSLITGSVPLLKGFVEKERVNDIACPPPPGSREIEIGGRKSRALSPQLPVPA